MFFIFYALSELPSNLIIRPIGVVPYLSFLILAWGAVAMCLGFVQNFVQLTVLRLLLGLFEGGLNVCVIHTRASPQSKLMYLL